MIEQVGFIHCAYKLFCPLFQFQNQVCCFSLRGACVSKEGGKRGDQSTKYIGLTISCRRKGDNNNFNGKFLLFGKHGENFRHTQSNQKIVWCAPLRHTANETLLHFSFSEICIPEYSFPPCNNQAMKFCREEPPLSCQYINVISLPRDNFYCGSAYHHFYGKCIPVKVNASYL